MPTNFPSPATTSSSLPTPSSLSPRPPAPQSGLAPGASNPPPLLLQVSNTSCCDLLGTRHKCPDNTKQPGAEIGPCPSIGASGLLLPGLMSTSTCPWLTHCSQNLLPSCLVTERLPAPQPAPQPPPAVSEHGGSWQPRSGNPCFWVAAAVISVVPLLSPHLKATWCCGELGVQCTQQQQWDVPGILSSQGTAASLPSHLENLIHANYAEKSSSDNEYEMEA